MLQHIPHIFLKLILSFLAIQTAVAEPIIYPGDAYIEGTYTHMARSKSSFRFRIVHHNLVSTQIDVLHHEQVLETLRFSARENVCEWLKRWQTELLQPCGYEFKQALLKANSHLVPLVRGVFFLNDASWWYAHPELADGPEEVGEPFEHDPLALTIDPHPELADGPEEVGEPFEHDSLALTIDTSTSILIPVPMQDEKPSQKKFGEDLYTTRVYEGKGFSTMLVTEDGWPLELTRSQVNGNIDWLRVDKFQRHMPEAFKSPKLPKSLPKPQPPIMIEVTATEDAWVYKYVGSCISQRVPYPAGIEDIVAPAAEPGAPVEAPEPTPKEMALIIPAKRLVDLVVKAPHFPIRFWIFGMGIKTYVTKGESKTVSIENEKARFVHGSDNVYLSIVPESEFNAWFHAAEAKCQKRK